MRLIHLCETRWIRSVSVIATATYTHVMQSLVDRTLGPGPGRPPKSSTWNEALQQYVTVSLKGQTKLPFQPGPANEAEAATVAKEKED